MCAENQNHEKLALFYENDFFPFIYDLFLSFDFIKCTTYWIRIADL